MAVTMSPVRLTQTDLESIIERALQEARARGASQAEAAVSQDTGLSVGVRLGEVETLEHQRDRSMGITVYFGQRKGSASTADFQQRRWARRSPRPAVLPDLPPKTPVPVSRTPL